jgi:hypothetical protein
MEFPVWMVWSASAFMQERQVLSERSENGCQSLQPASLAGMWVMASPPVGEDRRGWFEERGNESRIKAETDVETDANGVEG